MKEKEKYKGKLKIIQAQIQSLDINWAIKKEEAIKNRMDIKSIQVFLQPLDLG